MDEQAFKLLMKRFDRVDEDNKEIKGSLEKQNGRIRSLEDTRTRQRGIMAFGGALVTFMSAISTYVVNYMRH